MPRVAIPQNAVPLARTTDAKFQAANPGPSGLGAGLQSLGRGLDELADTRIIYDEAAAKQAYSTAERQVNETLYTGDNAYLLQRGAAAIDGQKPTTDAIAKIRADAVASLKNPDQQRYFTKAFDDRLLPELQKVAVHADRETRTYGISQSQARQEGASNSAILNVDTPELYQSFVATGEGEIDAEGRLSGWAPEVVAQKKQAYRSDIVSRVAAQKAIADPVGAAAWAHSHDSDLLPDAQAKLEAMLRGPLLERQAAADVDGLIGAQSGAAASTPVQPGSGSPLSRMVAITAFSESRNRDRDQAGNLVTSPAGAQGRMQVMPGTNTDPGFGVRPAKDDSDEERARVGRDYLSAMMSRYGGDPAKAWAAYNAGPGRVDKLVASYGGDWLKHAPAETKDYVATNVAALGGASASYAPRRDDLAGLYDAIDRQPWDFERKKLAREEADRRVARDGRMLARQQEDAQNGAYDVLTKLGDGFTDINQLPADVRASLSGADRFRFKTMARKNAEAQAENAADLLAFNQASATPGFTWNRFDPRQRKLVDAAVKAKGGTPEAAFGVWQNTGILAAPALNALRGGLVSTNPQQVRASANIAGNMLRLDPNAFAGTQGGDDIEHAALSFNHYVFDLAMSPDAAAARVAQENTPEYKAKIKIGQPVLDEYRKQISKTGADNSARALGGTFASPGRQQEANATYTELTVDNLSKGKDLATAQAIAAQQMKKIYGVSRDGRIRKYPPELAYPSVGGSFDYIYQDAAKAVKAVTGVAVTPSQVHLTAIAGTTDEDMRNGRPARYRIIYEHDVKGQKVRDIVPGDFTADIAAATQEASDSNAQAFKRARADQESVRRERAVRAADPTLRPSLSGAR